MNTGWNEYLNFSRKETLGIVILLAIILILVLLPGFFDIGDEHLDAQDFESFRKELADLQDSAAHREKNDSTSGLITGIDPGFSPQREGPKTELFEFDPNTLSAEGWEKLGLKKKTIATIQRYLAKGGIFREPSDIAKIYGLREEDRERILPYIRIKSKNPDGTDIRDTGNYTATPKPRTNTKRSFVIDINKSDTASWTPLPGIGGKLAARIIKFRDKLGGFHSVNQVGEIYGLQDSVFRNIRSFLKVETPELRKLNINQMEETELNQHPYISRDLARSIVRYRIQHGKFKRLQDLMQLGSMTPEIYEKLTPYLSIE